MRNALFAALIAVCAAAASATPVYARDRDGDGDGRRAAQHDRRGGDGQRNRGDGQRSRSDSGPRDEGRRSYQPPPQAQQQQQHPRFTPQARQDNPGARGEVLRPEQRMRRLPEEGGPREQARRGGDEPRRQWQGQPQQQAQGQRRGGGDEGRRQWQAQPQERQAQGQRRGGGDEGRRQWQAQPQERQAWQGQRRGGDEARRQWQAPPQQQAQGQRRGGDDGRRTWQAQGDRGQQGWDDRRRGDERPNHPRFSGGSQDRLEGSRDRNYDRRDGQRDYGRRDDGRRQYAGRDYDRNGRHDFNRQSYRDDPDRWRDARRRYGNTHSDWRNPRYSDWRRIPRGRYFDYGYAHIVHNYYHRSYYWWGYDGWRRPYRPWSVGYALPYWIYWEPLPYDLYYQLPPAPYGCRYVYVDGDILLVAIATGLIIDALLLASY